MAKGKKTGGRNFPKGHTGRPKGTKDRVSRKTFREMFENILAGEGAKVEAGLAKQLKKGHPFLSRTAAEYVDGKPVQEVRVRPLQPLQIILTPEDEGEGNG